MSVRKDPLASFLVTSYSKYPSVSIVIPTYNEVDNIDAIINCFLASNYPNLLEIVVVDGQSTDGTSERVKQLAHEYPVVKIIENPQRIQSAALNIGLKACAGDIFVRADAHCDYAPDYIEQCVLALRESKALNVGGCQRFVARTPFQAAIALASRSWLGSGGAKYRDPNYSGYADTVYLGCFKRQALLEVTLSTQEVFDTTQVTNQDAELNQRLLDQSPQAIYVSSKIEVWYYPRKTWRSLWNQYFKYGRGRYLTTIKHPERSQIRGKLPFLFVSTMILLLVYDLFFSPVNLYIKEICILGVLLAFVESLRVNLKLKDNFVAEIWRGNPQKPPSFLSRWFYCSIVILTMPLAHFSGYGYQVFKTRILNNKSW
ncbi:glycosyltransferase family 2 protein [Pleurocapsales cyanobacterium LEGE 10410]|nr:glycosyltransferase family 2 protein [Pleurocapsales cyanobacterium LEGE 10410]